MARPLPPYPAPPEPYAPGQPPGRTAADPPEQVPGRTAADPPGPPERGRSGDRTLDPEPWRREPGSEPS
jgi:hypothetical protein